MKSYSLLLFVAVVAVTVVSPSTIPNTQWSMFVSLWSHFLFMKRKKHRCGQKNYPLSFSRATFVSTYLFYGRTQCNFIPILFNIYIVKAVSHRRRQGKQKKNTTIFFYFFFIFLSLYRDTKISYPGRYRETTMDDDSRKSLYLFPALPGDV